MQKLQRFKNTELGEIPEDWDISSIDSFLKINMGQSPPSETYNMDRKGLPFYQGVTDFGNIFPKSRVWCSNPKKIANENEILLSVRAPVGELNITDEKCCIGRGIASLIPINSDLEYCFYLLKLFKNKFTAYSQGSTFEAINRDEIGKIKVPFSNNIKEQHKIASILSNIDELIQKTEQIIEQTQRLKKGLMQRLLTKGIRHTKFKKLKWLFGKKIEIPEEWNMVSLDDVCKNITDGKHGDCVNEEGSEYYFISAKDIFEGKIHYEKSRQITKSDFLDAHRRTKVEPGDVLLTNSGSIGKLAIVRNISKTARTTFQKSVAILKPNIDKVVVEFLYYYLHSNQKQLETIASGSSQKNLLLRQLDSFRIPLPFLSEQNKIGHILSNIDFYIHNNEEYQSKLETLKKGLMQQLLTGKIRVKV